MNVSIIRYKKSDYIPLDSRKAGWYMASTLLEGCSLELISECVIGMQTFDGPHMLFASYFLLPVEKEPPILQPS